MSYFSRLTDIVTCNLSALLAESEDPAATLTEIIGEMREGLAGAKRSVSTAAASEARLAAEIDDHRRQAGQWDDKARSELAGGREAEARNCLMRKREIQDLIAGLEQQHRAAQATKDHLSTMHRALEARLAEAVRRQQELGAPLEVASASAPNFSPPAAEDPHSQIEAELEDLKRQMGLK